MSATDEFAVGDYVTLDHDRHRSTVWTVTRKLKVNYELAPVGEGRPIRAPRDLIRPATDEQIAAAKEGRILAADVGAGPILRPGQLVVPKPNLALKGVAPGTVFAVVRISERSVTIEPISGEGHGWRVPAASLLTVQLSPDLLTSLAATAA